MLDPTALFEMVSHVDPRTVRAKTLVVTLGSFVDAGQVQRLVDEHLLNTLPNHVLAHFDADQVLDFRGHRPLITFDRDHFTDYAKPEITLHHVVDANGVPFLLLTGPEPAFQWGRMADAIEILADRFDVRLVATLQGIPMAVPHTRPVSVTRSASKPSLIPGNQPLIGTIRMGASFPAALSVRLAEADYDVVGLAANVPHYVSEMEYPAAAIAVLDTLGRHAGLDLPTGELEQAAKVVEGQIAQSVEQNPDAAEMVAEVERRHDAVVAELSAAPQTMENLPTADELAAEAEEFLRGLGEG